MLLNLLPSITETSQYKASIFPGGEVDFKLTDEFIHQLTNSEENSFLDVVCRINTPQQIMFLGVVLGTLAKDFDNRVNVYIPYFPYQQADRDFALGECFSLITMVKMLDSFPRHAYIVFDPHSDVTPALLSYIGHTKTITNAVFIENALIILKEHYEVDVDNNLVLLSPDAGAYKKIFKLAKEIDFKGQIECANKYRNPKTGEIDIRLSVDDFGGKNVLIIDDICLGGGTFEKLGSILVSKNVGNLNLAVSHGIFNNGFTHLEKYFQNIFCTNSVKDVKEYEGLSENLNVYEII